MHSFIFRSNTSQNPNNNTSITPIGPKIKIDTEMMAINRHQLILIASHFHHNSIFFSPETPLYRGNFAWNVYIVHWIRDTHFIKIIPMPFWTLNSYFINKKKNLSTILMSQGNGRELKIIQPHTQINKK